MRIFRNKHFSRFAKKAQIDDILLCKAVLNAEKGLIDADLGGGIIKQRIARSGGGKSGGFRTIILFKSGDKAFFIYGFAKNEIDNISNADLLFFKELAVEMLNYKEDKITDLITKQKLFEVYYDKKTIP